MLCYKYSSNIHCQVSKKYTFAGSGCGSVGRAVAFDTRGPRFDSSQRQNFIEHLFIINCIEKMKINKKRPGMAHFKKNSYIILNLGCFVSVNGHLIQDWRQSFVNEF